MKLLLPIISIMILCACNSENKTPKTDSSTNKTSKNKTMADHTKVMREIEDTFHVLKTDIQFKSLDGLPVTATISEISESAPYILLCHQAGFSRGEYLETQEWLNSLGFNTLAIDQRSGDQVNEIINETAKLAESKGLEISYANAEQDIRAAIGHISHLIAGPDRTIFLLGSSYSAGLVLKIASDSSFAFKNQLGGVMSFSPGEYYPEFKLKPLLTNLKVPCFVTSSHSEFDDLKALMTGAPDSTYQLYKPMTESVHGSRALWATFPEHVKCREAVQSFLTKNT